MSQTFVLAKDGKALMPRHPARARALLKKGRVVVHRTVPFVIRLKGRNEGQVQPLQVKLGPGSKITGMALVPLHIEHIHPKARGGTDRVSNLTLACAPCNTAKGAQPVEVFLAKDPARLAAIHAQAKRPLKDATEVNSTRWALAQALKATGLPLEMASGGRTKWNRTRLGLPKTHALDTVCVGQVQSVSGWQRPVLSIQCAGRGSYQRTRLNAYGFPRGYLMRAKQVFGFQTGGRVCANVPKGKKTGRYAGRVAVRATGSFNLQTSHGVVQGISHRYCQLVQRSDGYGYSFNPKDSFDQGEAGAGRAVRDVLSLPGMNAGVFRANG